MARIGLKSASGHAARFPALRHVLFRRYVLGQLISLCGFWMQNVAQGWLVWRLSQSAFALGVVASLGSIPTAILSPLAGVFADRVDRRRLIIVTQSIAMLLAALVGVLIACDLVTVPVVAVAAACLGIVGAVDLPTRQSFLVELVGGDDLASAIALNASIFNAARVVGPAVAGIVVASLGEAPCFLLNAASYGAVLWVLVMMRLPPTERLVARGTAWNGLRSGMAYVRANPPVGALLVTLGIVSGLGLQSVVIMPAVAQEAFGLGARGYGLLLAAYGVGAATSALHLAAARPTLAGQGRTMCFGLAVFGAGLFVVTGSPWFGLALAAQVVAGFGMVRFTATLNGVLQQLVHDGYRGRVMGLHTSMFLGTAPVGSLVLGGVATHFGARAALAVAALTVWLAALWWAPRLQVFSQARHPATQN